MADGPKTPEEEGEAGVEKVGGKEENLALKKTFLRDFRKSHIKTDNNDFIKGLNEFFKKGEITSKETALFNRYKLLRGDKYKSLDLADISYEDVRDTFTEEFVSFSNSKAKLKIILLKEYDINTNDYNLLVLKEIDKLSPKELSDCLDSEFHRKTILETSFKGRSMPEKKDTSKILPQINDMEVRLSKLSKKDRREADLVLAVFHEDGKLGLDGIEALFDLNIFTTKEKVDILNVFAPTISLDKLLKFKFLNEKKAQIIKKRIIKEQFDKEGIGEIPEDKLTKIAKGLNNEKIELNSDIYLTSEANVSKFVAAGELQKVADAFEELKVNASVASSGAEKESLMNKKGFLEELEKAGVENAESFGTGSILAIEMEKPGTGIAGETATLYLEIVRDGFDRLDGNKIGNLDYALRGEGEYDVSNNQVPYLKSYSDFLVFIKDGNKEKGVSLIKNRKIFSQKEILEQIKLGDITAKGSLIEYMTDKEKESKSEELELKKDNLQKELDSEDTPQGKKTTLSEEIEGINTELEHLKNVNELNLKSKLDTIDPAGKDFGVDIGTTFLTEGEFGTTGQVYTISGISDGIIDITSINGPEKSISYNDFLRVFKDKSCTRTSKSTSMAELMSVIGNDSKLKDLWGEFRLDGNKLKKQKGNDKEYNYLVSEGGHGDERNLIKIHNISGNEVTVSFGKCKDTLNKDLSVEANKITKQRAHEVYNSTFSVESNTYPMSIGELETYIKSSGWGMEPRSSEEGDDKIKEEIDPGKPIKTKFFSKIFSNLNLAEILQGGKQWADNITEYMKEGNEEHASMFASKLPLPGELKNDAIARLDQARKKRMEDHLSKLKEGMDSGPATKLITRWLLNKNCPEYKKEAGLKFMIEKYGVLYCKELMPHKGKFLWFKALAHHYGDVTTHPLYIQVQAQRESENAPFNEEELVYQLLTKQCNPNSDFYPKRRSRLHKEYKKIRNDVGPNKELEKGIGDAKGIRNINSQVANGLRELGAGSPGCAIGWAKGAMLRGGPVHLMAKIPFVMAFSGMAYGLDDPFRIMMQGFYEGDKLSIPLFRMFTENPLIDVVNKAILAAAKEIETKQPILYKGIGKEAQKLFDDQKSGKPEKERVQKVIDFFDTSKGGKSYGEVIMNTLMRLDNGETGEGSELGGLLDYGAEDSNNQNAFDAFLNQEKMYLSNHVVNETFMSDGGMNKGLTLGANQIGEMLKVKTQGGFEHEIGGPATLNEIYNQFVSVASYGGTEKQRTARTKRLLSNMIEGIFTNQGAKADAIKSMDAPASVFSKFNDRWGISFAEMLNKGVSADNVRDHDNKMVEELLDKYVRNIITGRRTESNQSVDIIETRESVTQTASDVMGKPKGPK